MKSTFYGHFVAGEDLTTVLPLRERYRNLGIRSILDYSVEEDLPEETIRKSMGLVYHVVELRVLDSVLFL